MNMRELHTGYVLTYYMKNKSEVPNGLEYLRRYIGKLFSGTKLRHLWCDNAREHTSHLLDRWCARCTLSNDPPNVGAALSSAMQVE